MTPQSTFMVVAPIDPQRRDELRTLLRSMSSAPGMANPANDLVPFTQLENLHVARWLILDDSTSGDAAAYGVEPTSIPPSLIFMGDCDGPGSVFLRELAAIAGPGLRRLFSCCRDFGANTDLVAWMRAHEQPPATVYVNWIGRTVKQVREENTLRHSIVQYLAANVATLAASEPREIRAKILDFVGRERAAGRLKLTTPEATPFSWKVRNAIHLVAGPLILLLLSPAILLYLPVFAYQLRTREKRDPGITLRPDPAHIALLAALEDHDVSNQFSAYGMVKPGLFRRWTLTFLLAVVNYSTRHIYGRGRLARVSTIHFARWIFLNRKLNLFFASNYDGSLESYMDDFINKVAWGLNLVFSNGMGYPRTNWLIRYGAKDEQKFKYFIRRYQLPTDVWYRAYPGLSTIDLQRNTFIRQGLEQVSMTDSEIQSWLSLL